MWDVVWTDPDKELVGERRVRKAKSRNERHTALRNHNERHSIATESSLSSQDSPFTLWRYKARRCEGHSKGNTVTAQPTTPSLSGAAPPSLLSSISPFSKSFELESRRSSTAVTSAPTSPREGPVSSAGTHQSGSTKRTTIESFPLPPFDDTPFSQPRCSNEIGTVSKAQGDGQMSEMEKTGRLMQLLHELSSQNGLSVTRPLSTDDPRGSWDGSVAVDAVSVVIKDKPTTPSRSPHRINSDLQNKLESPVFLTPPPKSPLRRAPQNDVACWRPTAQWNSKDKNCLEHSQCKQIGSPKALLNSPKVSLELKLLQLDLSNMAHTSPVVALNRMRLLWSQDSNREQEIERQQWMLSTLQNIHHDAYETMRNARLEVDIDTDHEQHITLVLHESADIVKNLSLLKPKQFYGSIDAKSLDSTAAMSLVLPDGTGKANNVFSLSLFSQWKMKDIPKLLRNIRQSLRTDGIFKVTVMDPLPCIHTMGEAMFSWMSKYLLKNIEEGGFCSEPCRVLPKYLDEAQLRGKGSKCTLSKFYALPENARSLQRDPDPSLERLRKELETKAELRSFIGRALWMEVWGRLVAPQPAKWWWEDESCIEECRILGTFWEFRAIDAVRME